MNIRRLYLIVLPALAVFAVLVVVNANGSAGRANAQPKAKIELDMDPTNGDAPCNPVDATRGVSLDDTYQVAICVTDAPVSVAAFNVELNYDSALDECVPKDCPDPIPCADGNPDANLGSTTWTTPDLGVCDCTSGGLNPPTCDYNPGTSGTAKTAYISCVCIVPEEQTLPSGEGVSIPIAMVTFKKVAEGVDTLNFGTVGMYVQDAGSLLSCPGPDCGEGSSDVGAAPASPTPESTLAPGTTPGSETTPGGEVATTEPAVATASAATAVAQGTPIAAINQAATAASAAVATKAASSAKTPTAKATAKPGSTSDANGGGSSGPNALLIAGIVVVAAIVVGGGGWFGYRRFRLKR